MYVCMYVCMSVCVCVSVCMYACMYVCMYMNIYCVYCEIWSNSILTSISPQTSGFHDSTGANCRYGTSTARRVAPSAQAGLLSWSRIGGMMFINVPKVPSSQTCSMHRCTLYFNIEISWNFAFQRAWPSGSRPLPVNVYADRRFEKGQLPRRSIQLVCGERPYGFVWSGASISKSSSPKKMTIWVRHPPFWDTHICDSW